MNHALVIATREVREKGRMFILALILAVLPFVAALVPAMRGWGSSMVIGSFGGALALAMGLGLAIAFGSTAIGRELSERRLSFYLSKPLSPLAIWFGKAAGGMFTAFACFAIIAIPAFLASRKIWGAAWTLSQVELVGIAAIAVAVLFLVSHALSTMVRSRSALLAIDLALLVGTGFALLSMVRPLLQGHATGTATALGVIVGTVLTLILLAAPVWQLARGRADVRRNHAMLSRFLWSGIAIVLACAAAYVWWVVTASPSDIVRGTILQAPGGQWLFASGPVKYRGDYNAALFLDAKSGSQVRLAGVPWYGPVFSRDGRTVAFGASLATPPRTPNDITLHVMRLGAEARPRDTRIVVTYDFALSDDGARLATLERGLVAVHDVGGERLLASARGIEGSGPHALMFVTNDLLRIYQFSNLRTKRVTIFELDIPRKTLTKTGESEVQSRYRGLAANADGSRMIVSEAGLLIDGRTGATLRRLPAASIAGTAFLADGTIVVADGRNGKVHILDGDGNPLREIGVERAPFARVTAEIEGGRVVVSLAKRPGRFVTYIVDVKRGALERELRDHESSMPWYSVDPRLPRMSAGAALAVYDRGEGLVLWDPRSGTSRKL